MISKLKAPQTTDQAYILRKVYDDLNSVIDSVNKASEKARPANTEGKSGDIRLVKGRHGAYFLHAKYEDGWVTTDANVMRFAKREEDLQPMVQANTGIASITTTKPGVYEVEVSEAAVGDLAIVYAVAL